MTHLLPTCSKHMKLACISARKAPLPGSRRRAAVQEQHTQIWHASSTALHATPLGAESNAAAQFASYGQGQPGDPSIPSPVESQRGGAAKDDNLFLDEDFFGTAEKLPPALLPEDDDLFADDGADIEDDFENVEMGPGVVADDGGLLLDDSRDIERGVGNADLFADDFSNVAGGGNLGNEGRFSQPAGGTEWDSFGGGQDAFEGYNSAAYAGPSGRADPNLNYQPASQSPASRQAYANAGPRVRRERGSYGAEQDSWGERQGQGRERAGSRYRPQVPEQSFDPTPTPHDPFNPDATTGSFAAAVNTMQELHSLVEQNQQQMAAQQVVDVLLRSIVIESRGLNARARKELFVAAQRFASDISPLVAGNALLFNNEQLLRVLQALTYLQSADVPLLHALLDKAAQSAPTFTPAELHELLWVAASSPSVRPSQEWLAHLAALCRPVLDQFEHDKAASLLHYFVACEFAPPAEWLDEYLLAVQPQLRAIHPSQTLHMLSALAATGHKPSASFLTALDVVLTTWDMVAVGHEGQKRLLLALLQWQHKPSGVAMASIVNGVLAGPVPPRAIPAMDLTSLQLHLGAEPSVRHMADVASLMVSEMQVSASASEAVQMVTALAHWTQQLPACSQSLRRACRTLAPILSGVQPSVLAQESAAATPLETPTTPAKQLAKLVAALAVLGVECPAAWMQDAANTLAGLNFEGLAGSELASLLPTLVSHMGFQPSTPWLSQFLQVSARTLPQAHPDQIVSTLQTLTTLQIQLPLQWWLEFGQALAQADLATFPADALSNITLSLGVLWSQTEEGFVRSGRNRVELDNGPQSLLGEVLMEAVMGQSAGLGEQDMSRFSVGLQLLSLESGREWLRRFDVFVQGRGGVTLSLVT